MANKIEIDIVANDKTSGAIKSIGGSFTELNSAIMIGEKVLGYMAKAYEMTVGAAQTYDQQVYELMLKTGGTADETSRLIQVLDDTGIEYGVLETAMKFAVKNGIDPNIKSLAKLADEYNALNSPVAKGQLLMAKFGRSGLEMARAMEMGGDALRQMNSEMSGGLILTEANIKASEEYRKNMDTMNDSVLGLKVSIGNELIPALNEQVLESNALIKSLQEQGYWYTMLHQWSIRSAASKKDETVEVNYATQSYNAMMLSINKAAEANRDAVAPTKDETAALKEQSAALDATNKALMKHNDQTMSIIGSLQSSWESYQSSYAAAQSDMSLNDDQRKAKLAELSAAYELETNKIILSMTAQVLASDGLTTKEMAYLLEAGKSYGIYSDSVVAAGMKAIDQIDALNRHLNELPQGRTFTFTVLQQGNLEAFYSTANMGGRGASHKASGGPVTAGTPYIVGEQGQEMFVPSQNGTIIPNNRLGGSVINISINTPALIGSGVAARDALLPILREGVRQLQSEGALPL